MERGSAGGRGRYDELLARRTGRARPSTQDGNAHVWHLYVVRVPERDRYLAAMSAAGIPAAIHYPTPIHLTGAFADLGYTRETFPWPRRPPTRSCRCRCTHTSPRPNRSGWPRRSPPR